MRRAFETAASINHDKGVTGADRGLVGADFGPCPGTERSYYNGDGLRVRRLMWDNPGTGLRKTTEDYTWDVSGGLPQILQETRTVGTGAPETVSYVYGLGLISVTDGSGTYYPLTDGLGSTVEVRDRAGARTESYVYDVFGALRSPEPSGAKTDRRFTGEQADVPVLRSPYYLRARHYDPGLGRFVQKDPVPFVQRYVYAANDPVNKVDPTGRCHDSRRYAHPEPAAPVATRTPVPGASSVPPEKPPFAGHFDACSSLADVPHWGSFDPFGSIGRGLKAVANFVSDPDCAGLVLNGVSAGSGWAATFAPLPPVRAVGYAIGTTAGAAGLLIDAAQNDRTAMSRQVV